MGVTPWFILTLHYTGRLSRLFLGLLDRMWNTYNCWDSRNVAGEWKSLLQRRYGVKIPGRVSLLA